MATLVQLQNEDVLRKLKLSLSRDEFEDREMWLAKSVRDWITNDVKGMLPFYEHNLPPRQQLSALLRDFITGKELQEGKMFWKMRPCTEDIFELKTPDIRIFGWFYRHHIFIAAHACSFAVAHATNGIHAYYRDETCKFRDTILLDDPKYIAGLEARDVF